MDQLVDFKVESFTITMAAHLIINNMVTPGKTTPGEHTEHVSRKRWKSLGQYNGK